MKKEEFYTFIKKIPKVEIHIHAEGIIGRKTVSKLLSKNEPEYTDMKKVDNLFAYNSLEEFIKVFLKIQRSFTSEEDFSLLFDDIKQYLVRNNIVYTEMFVAPSMFIKNGIDFNCMINEMIRKIKEIKKETSRVIKLIIDVSRSFGMSNAFENLERTINLIERSDEIIGIGLGGDEQKGPANDYIPVFERALKHKIHRVAHAGESVGPESVWAAIKGLKAERIGHGISSIQDEKLMQYLKKYQIPLEICPTSNIFTAHYVKKIENHPIREFYDRGLNVTLNSDDPTFFFNTDLIDEYWNLYSKLSFSLDDLKIIIINGINSSFMNKNDKKKLIKQVELAWILKKN